MKILFIHQYFCPPDGTGNNRSLEVCTELVKSGVKITVITGKSSFPSHYFKEAKPYWIFNINGIEVIVLNTNYSHFMSFYRRIFAFASFFIKAWQVSRKQNNFDYIYTVSTPLTIGLLGVFIKRKFKKPLLFEIGDLWPDVPVQMGIIKNTFLKSALYRMESLIYKESDIIISLSKGMTELLLKKGIAANKIATLPNGTNNSYFTPASAIVKSEARAKLHYKETDKIVLYAGTMGFANGVDILVRAADYFKKHSHANINILIIGNGNRRHILEKGIAGMHNIKIHNEVPKQEIELFFNAATIGIACFAPFPILSTNSANKFFDYLAAGLPVCTNYEGWQAEYLRTFECGLAAASNNEIQFFENIIQLCNSPRLDTYSENARELSVTQFDRKDIAQKLIGIVKSV